MNKGIVVSLGLAVILSGAAAGQVPPASKAGAAESPAPKIVKPAPGTMVSGDVTLKIEPGPGSGTKNFALDWQAKTAGAWTPRDVLDSAGLGEQKIPAVMLKSAGEWRVRARAIEAENANWSDWREFRTPAPATRNKKTPCGKKAAYGASYDVSATPATLKAGATVTAVAIKVTNLSSRTWGADSEYRLSYHWARNGATVVKDGERTPLVRVVRPCGTTVLKATLKAPDAPGVYTLMWDMLREGAGWFSAKGVATGNREVTVTP